MTAGVELRMRWRAAVALAAAALLFGACAASRPAGAPTPPGGGRRVTVRLLRPPPVNLGDREVETVAVLGFSGAEGPALAENLSRGLAGRRALAVVGPRAMEERLLRLGLAAGWDTAPSQLRWIHERAGVDAVVVGRLEVFEIADREHARDTLSPVETGEYGFVVNDEGKLAYREKVELRPVPLYCRTDLGTVAASYRVWDTRRGELVATLRHELSTEVPSFCYRGDVPLRVARAAQQRLLRRLFTDLNQRFLADILPVPGRGEVVFAPLPGGAGGALVQANELAILYASRNQWRRAVETWQDGLRDRPDLAPLHYNLAVAYRATCRLTRARAELQQALALDPGEPLYRGAARGEPEAGEAVPADP